MPASQPGSGTWGPPRPLAGQRDGASGDRNVERASAGGTSGGLLRRRGFCTPRLSTSGVVSTVQFRNLDPGVGAQRVGKARSQG